MSSPIRKLLTFWCVVVFVNSVATAVVVMLPSSAPDWIRWLIVGVSLLASLASIATPIVLFAWKRGDDKDREKRDQHGRDRKTYDDDIRQLKAELLAERERHERFEREMRDALREERRHRELLDQRMLELSYKVFPVGG